MTGPAAAWLIILGTTVVTGQGAAFVLGKIALIAAGVLLAALTPSSRRLPRPLVVAALVAAGIWAIAGLLSADTWLHLVGGAPRYDGVMVLLLAGVVWAAGRVLGAGARRHLSLALSTTALIHAPFAVSGALAAPLLVTTAARGGGLLGQASDLGLLGSVIALALLALPRTALTWPGLVAGVLIAVSSGSRGAWLALAMGLLVYVAVTRSWRRPVMLAGLLVAGVLAFPSALARATTDGVAATSGASRIDMWRQSLSLVVETPFGAVAPYREAFVPTGRLAELTADAPLDHPHNLVVDLGVAGGLPLVIAAVVLAAIWLRAVPAKERPLALPVAAAVTVAWSLSPLAIGSLVAPALTVGSVVGRDTGARAPAAPRVVAGLVSSVLVVGAVLGVAAERHVVLGRQAEVLGLDEIAVEQLDRARTLRPWDPDLRG